MFFLILAVYIDYARKPSAWRYLAVMALFALGLLAKPMLVTVPLVLLLLDYWPLRRRSMPAAAFTGCERAPPAQQASRTKLLVEKLPLVAIALASASVTILAQQKALRSLQKVPLTGRVANAFVSYVIYLARLVFPVDLAAFYPYTPRSPLELSAIGSLLLLLMVSVCAWVLRRRVPSLLVGWLWYLLMLLPVIGLIQVGDQALADRYTYLPLIGPCLVVFGLPIGAAKQFRRLALAVAATCILAVLTVCGWRQTTFWRDSRTLWTRALSCTTDNWLAHINLGDVLFRVNEPDAAVAEFREATRLYPHSFVVINNLGVVYVYLDKTDEAIACFNEALKIEPWHADAHTNLGDALYKKGRIGEAIDQWSEALSYEPDDFFALNSLAWARATSPEASMRNGKEALGLAKRAVELSAGRDPKVLATLAAAYAEEGRFGEAESTLMSAIQLAERRKKSDFAAKLRRRLELYQAGKPEYVAR